MFIQKIKREDINGKKLLKLTEKYYLTDHGFTNILYYDEKTNIGHRLENIICIKMLRRGYAVTAGKIDTKEVDFICRKENYKIYIQVAYLLKNSKIENREFTPLNNIKDNYGKIVVTMDTIDFYKEGIEHYNIIDFLLSEDF